MIGHLVGKFYENSRSTLIVFLAIFLFARPSECAEYSIATFDTDEAKPLAKLAKVLYERIGHSTKFYFLPAKRSLAEVNAGIRDAELARIIGLDAVYPNLVRVPEPIYSISVSAVVGKASGITSVSWDDLQSLTFVRVLGLRFIEIRTADYEGTPAPSPESVVAMVAHGRVDVGLLLTTDAIKYAAKIGGVNVLEPPIGEPVLYHYVHVGNRDLVPALTKALQELNKSGRSEAILRGE